MARAEELADYLDARVPVGRPDFGQIVAVELGVAREIAKALRRKPKAPRMPKPPAVVGAEPK